MDVTFSVGGVLKFVVFPILGLGLLYFVLAATGIVRLRWLVHEQNQELSQENRRAEWVGAKPLPKEPIKLVIRDIPNECLKIDRAAIEGDYVVVYYRNSCQLDRQYGKIVYKGYAPDETIVVRDYAYAFTTERLFAGEKGEWRTKRFNDDPRIVKVEFYMESMHY